MATDLLTSFQFAAQGLNTAFRDIAVTRTIEGANRQVQEIRDAQIEDAKKRSLLEELSQQTTLQLSKIGAPIQRINQISESISPARARPQTAAQALLFGDPEQQAVALEIQAREQKLTADAFDRNVKHDQDMQGMRNKANLGLQKTRDAAAATRQQKGFDFQKETQKRQQIFDSKQNTIELLKRNIDTKTKEGKELLSTILKQTDKFTTDKVVKELRIKIQEAKSLEALADTGTALSYQAGLRSFLRLAGETGKFTDKDVENAVPDPSIRAGVLRALNRKFAGKALARDFDLLRQVTRDLVVSNRRQIRSEAAAFSNRASLIPGVDKRSFENILLSTTLGEGITSNKPVRNKSTGEIFIETRNEAGDVTDRIPVDEFRRRIGER